MKLARVLGSITSTHKNKELEGEKLLWLQPVGPDGKEEGKPVLAVDRVDAGKGDLVIYLDEGGSAKLIMGKPRAPVRVVVVGVVDSLTWEGESCKK
ncbi:hypothetical protein DRQ18_03685 [bacterium]|nr:MAG: hypothetical protein DRQ18_03685 [bacterium]